MQPSIVLICKKVKVEIVERERETLLKFNSLKKVRKGRVRNAVMIWKYLLPHLSRKLLEKER